MARLAQLGIAFDSSPAKRGAAEAQQALNAVAATATRTAATLDKSTADQIRAHERATSAANRRANEDRRAAAAAAQMMRDQQRVAAMAAEALKLEADAAQVAAMRMAALHTQALRMDAAMTNASAAFGLGEAGANRLRGAVTGLMAPMLQTAGSANVLASTVGSLALGNAATAGILGGLTAIAVAYDAVRASADAARQKAQESFQALEAFRKREQQGTLGETPQQIATQLRVIQDAQRKIVEARRELAASLASLDAVGAKTGVVGRTTLAGGEIARLEQELAASQRAVAAGTREITRITTEANAEYSRAQTERLAGLVRGNAATIAEQERLRDRLRNLQAELNTLTATGGDPARRAQLVADIATITSVYEAQAKAVAGAARTRARAESELADVGERLVVIMRDLGMRSDAALQSEAERAEKIKAFVAAQRQQIEVAQEEYAAIQSGALALRQFAEVQAVREAGTRAVAEALRVQNALSADDIALVRAQGEELARLELRNKNARNADGGSTGRAPVEATRRWGEELASVVTVARDLAQIFGDVGTQITKAVQLSSQMFTAYRAAAAAAAQLARAQADGGSTPDQIASARRASTGASIAAGASFLTASVSVITAWSSAVERSAEEAERLAIALREQRLAAVNSASQFVARANGNALDRELSDLTESFRDVIAQLLAAGAPRVDRLGGRTARSVVPTADDVDGVIDAYERMVAAAKEAAAFQLAQAEGDLRVRALTAAGRAGEADAFRTQLQQARELRDAEAQFGKDSPYLQHLRDVQAAEVAVADMRRIEQRTAFGLGLTQRRQSLNGDDRGAFLTGQTIQNNAALAQAQQLLEAGTITAAMFEELRVLLGDEMTAALRDFEAAAQAAKQAVLDDLAVRALVAQGKGLEADQLRTEIANRKELEGVTDDALRAQILYVQGLEAEARTKARAAEEAKKIADESRSIQAQIIELYKTLDPAKAKELQQLETEVSRKSQLAAAQNDFIRGLLEQLFAMQDLAAAQAAVTAEVEKQKKAAEDLRSFMSDVDVEYLRASGRDFEADTLSLQAWRDDRLNQARSVGASDSVIAQINATFDLKYAKLIEKQMQGAAQAAETAATARANETGVRATTNFAGVADTTALRMLDVQLSQLTVLREIAAKGGAGAGGISVQITVTGSPLVAQTPQQVGRDIVSQLAPVLDQYLGRRIGTERRLLGKTTL